MAPELSDFVGPPQNYLYQSNLESSSSASDSLATPGRSSNDCENVFKLSTFGTPVPAVEKLFTFPTPHKRDNSVANIGHAIKKPKQKRRGKVITKLRETHTLQSSASVSYATNAVCRTALGSFNLAPSSTTAIIGSKQMAGSLLWHLINLTGAETAMSGRVSPSKDLRVAYENLAHMAMQTCSGGTKLDFSGGSRLNEVIFCALAAIGARRSFHSAIVGLDGCRLGENAPLDLVVKLQIGMRREQACHGLVDIAIEKLQSSGFMKDSSPEAYDALTLARMMMFATGHEHNFALQILDALKPRSKSPTTHGDSIARAQFENQLLLFDMDNAILNGGPLHIKDEELFLYGWKYTDVRFGRRYEPVLASGHQAQRIIPPFVSDVLSSSSIEHDPMTSAKQFSHSSLLSATGFYREALYLRTVDPLLQLPTSVMAPFFKRLVGDFERTMGFILDVRISQNVVLPHVMGMVHLLPSVMVHEVQKRCQGRSDDETQELLNDARRFLLRWLHHFVVFIHNLRQVDATLHTVSLMMTRFDMLPGWIEIAIDGATQHSMGIGPLSQAGFTFDDLEILHECWKRTSIFFGSIGKREEELAAALSSAKLRMRAGGNVLGAEGVPEEPEPSIDARLMVDSISKYLTGREDKDSYGLCNDLLC